MALVALGAAALLLQRLNHPAGTPAARSPSEPLPPPVPRIDLARLSAERPDSGAGNRDLFRFGAASRSEEDEDELPVVTVPVATPTPGLPVDSASGPVQAPSLPPLSLRYLGSVENRAGVKVAVLLNEEGPGKVKASLRGKGDVPVNAIAHRFGGGGHENAAGCTISGTLEEAAAALLQAVRESLGAARP